MPIFEYGCKGCGNEFELLILPHSQDTARCPSCGGQDLDQLISLFSVSTVESRKVAMSGARKKAEKVIRDKKVAEAEAMRNHS